MTRAVWRYPIAIADEPTHVSVPAGAEFMSVLRAGDGSPSVYYLCEPHLPRTIHSFRIVGTGHPVNPDERYRGSFNDGPFVWHVFEGPIAGEEVGR